MQYTTRMMMRIKRIRLAAMLAYIITLGGNPFPGDWPGVHTGSKVTRTDPSPRPTLFSALHWKKKNIMDNLPWLALSTDRQNFQTRLTPCKMWLSPSHSLPQSWTSTFFIFASEKWRRCVLSNMLSTSFESSYGQKFRESSQSKTLHLEDYQYLFPL